MNHNDPKIDSETLAKLQIDAVTAAELRAAMTDGTIKGFGKEAVLDERLRQAAIRKRAKAVGVELTPEEAAAVRKELGLDE